MQNEDSWGWVWGGVVEKWSKIQLGLLREELEIAGTKPVSVTSVCVRPKSRVA